MGHRNLSSYHHLEKEQHQSVDGLLTLFKKANHDLTTVHNKLEKEFQQVYPDNANPMKLVSRIKKVQDEMCSLKEQCRELLAAKQIRFLSLSPLFIEVSKALSWFFSQKKFPENFLACCAEVNLSGQNLLSSQVTYEKLKLGYQHGVPVTSDSDDPSYASFNQVIDEWTTQVRSRTEDESPESGEDINQMLFSAIVHDN
ncbi:putative fasciclin-like arabinogalactan protein 14-like [Capsicum annuum]|nr:putative fasciclin-like arabinogalactan protein 14-like [Capsicum annuum]